MDGALVCRAPRTQNCHESNENMVVAKRHLVLPLIALLSVGAGFNYDVVGSIGSSSSSSSSSSSGGNRTSVLSDNGEPTTLQARFGMSHAAVQSLYSVYSFTNFLFALLSGLLLDRALFSTTLIAAATGVVFTALFGLACMFGDGAGYEALLFAARILLGCGNELVVVAAQLFITRYYPRGSYSLPMGRASKREAAFRARCGASRPTGARGPVGTAPAAIPEQRSGVSASGGRSRAGATRIAHGHLGAASGLAARLHRLGAPSGCRECRCVRRVRAAAAAAPGAAGSARRVARVGVIVGARRAVLHVYLPCGVRLRLPRGVACSGVRCCFPAARGLAALLSAAACSDASADAHPCRRRQHHADARLAVRSPGAATTHARSSSVVPASSDADAASRRRRFRHAQ
jgi:hypothetical protein